MELSREDRMRQRMRGAARHQVENADFGDLFDFAIPAPDPDPEPESTTGESSDPPAEPSLDPTPKAPAPPPVKRTDPNTSAKRRRLNSNGPSGPVPGPTAQPPASIQQSSSANRSSRRASRAPAALDPYDFSNAPSTVNGEGADASNEHEEATSATPASRALTRRAGGGSATSVPSSAVRQVQVAPQPSSAKSLPGEEVVTESPADDPGSGHRQRVRASDAITSSALLQSALRSVENDNTGEGYLQSSSPLSRKSRKSVAEAVVSARSTRTGTRRSPRLSGSPVDEVNDLSLELQDDVEEPSGAGVHSEDLSLEENSAETADAVVVEEEPSAAPVAEPEEAEEVNDTDVALRLRRKRPRRPEPVASPELSSGSPEPVAKRHHKAPPPNRMKRTPAKQRQPKAPRAKSKKSAAARKDKDGDAGGALPIKIQRFTRPQLRDGEGSDDEDPLNATIPYETRREVNAVDVLAGMCEVSIDKATAQLAAAIRNTPHAAGKKELRVQLKALEMFDEELRTQLLGHAIALDDLYALKKRVRDAQRAKLKLRDRITDIRTEREQVQLRMDAVRVKHEEDSREAMHNIHLSAAMHDIDLAVEQGHAAPELSAKEQKKADLANLELLISQVSQRACSSGPGGGALKQIKSFNAFLERVAAVL